MHKVFTKHSRRKSGSKMEFLNLQKHILVFLIFLIKMVSSAGNFELEILEISNTNSHLLTGYCCGLPSSIKNTKTTGCPPCSTAFRLCLKEYQTNDSGASVSTGCSFGNATTSVLGGSSFVLNYPSNIGSIVLPFTFRWTKSFTLILQAFDIYDNTSYTDPERLIEETSYSGVILPSPEWKTLDHIGKNARITYRVKVQCAMTYYNTTCTTFCRPRNDPFGHYSCGPEGEKVCLDGWKGDNCDIPICKPGCDPIHGNCDLPGECECRPGWRGPLCDECMVHPGCKHGSCNGSAWKCVCDTNWGGILCDQDLNYCGTHEPCMHGGTCENTAPDKYRCTCAEGLSGERCEVVEHPCATQPCQNGGTCILKKEDLSRGPQPTYRAMRGMSSTMGKPLNHRNSMYGISGLSVASTTSISNFNKTTNISSIGNMNNNSNKQQSLGVASSQSIATQLASQRHHHHQPPLAEFTCACAPGWTGPLCEINIDECAGSPCKHGGTCIDLIGGFRCECPNEWTGDLCDVDVDECKATYSYFQTTRLPEEIQNLNKINESAALSLLGAKTYSPCVNAQECINLAGSFKCICNEGWGGPTCADNLDDCADQCKNGAKCIDLVNDYHCACATGYAGRDCETDINECANSPCRNGGECVDLIGKFNCICPLGYSGSLCEEAKDHCTPSPCLEGRCLNTPGSYYCHCPPNRAGKHCENNRQLCSNPPCNDECVPENSTTITPCSSHGSCETSDAGRFCKCHIGYIGKYCEQNLNECLPNPCKNGGICIDGDGDFSCECPAGWSGKWCSERATECYKGQCQNGGTCVSGTPDKGIKSYCQCASGWSGLFCTDSIDQCHGQPCHNGGTCESGPNWFRCLCAKGFSGPDCRININECSPQPCQGGATCIDGIGDYSCICPPERFGLRCEIMISDLDTACLNTSDKTSPYFFLNQTEDNIMKSSSGGLEEHCNSCICEKGVRRCTNLWCGLPNCFRINNSTKTSNLSGVCKQHEVCVPTLTETCLSPPCATRGDCRSLEPSRRVAPPKLPAKSDCWPNQAILNENCARLNIIMDLQKVSEGSSIEGICSALRVLLATKLIKLPKNDIEGMLIIICDLKIGTNDTIEVTLSSTEQKDPNLSVAIGLLSELLSKRHASNMQNRNDFQRVKFAPLVSVLEVKVETARVENSSNHSLIIGMLFGILIVLLLFALCFCLFWRKRLTFRSVSGINLTPSADISRHEEEKSNNIQNEENLRRYTNPLKASTPSLNRTNIMELSMSTSPVATVSPLGATSSSALHRSQPLFSPLDRSFEQEVEFCDNKKKMLSEVQKRSSQLLLKTQNSDVKNNISGSLDSPSKNFSKRSIKCKSMLSTDPSGDGDVLTVVV